MEKTLKPSLRFKGFTDTWEQYKLRDISIYKNGTSNEGGQSSLGKYELINLNSIDIEGGLKSSNKFIDYASETLQKNDIVMVLSDVAHGYLLGRVALIPEDNRYVLNQRVALLRINIEANPSYIARNINANQLYFKNLGAGSSQLNISKSTVENYMVGFPTIVEQVKIASLFDSLDNLITLHQRKYDKLVNVKKALLDKMFPKNGELVPRLRFKGFTEAWEQCKLTDEVTLFGGLTYSPNNIVKENGTLVLRSSNVKDGEIIDADNVFVSHDVVNVDNVKNGDIIVVVRNGSRSLIGKHAQIKKNSENTVIGAFMSGLRSDQPQFINALLDTPLFKKEIDKNLGATINQITNGMFHQMFFLMPDNTEKSLIGKTFNYIDKLITLHQRKYEKLVNMKKALLQKMFV